MKRNFSNLFFSLLALLLFAYGIGLFAIVGVILMPLAYVAVFILMVREIFLWRKKTKAVGSSHTVAMRRRGAHMKEPKAQKLNEKRSTEQMIFERGRGFSNYGIG